MLKIGTLRNKGIRKIIPFLEVGGSAPAPPTLLIRTNLYFRLSKIDFENLYERLTPYNDTKEICDYVFSKFDKNNDGYIEPKDFIHWLGENDVQTNQKDKEAQTNKNRDSLVSSVVATLDDGMTVCTIDQMP